jgi:hypothetical protein
MDQIFREHQRARNRWDKNVHFIFLIRKFLKDVLCIHPSKGSFLVVGKEWGGGVYNKLSRKQEGRLTGEIQRLSVLLKVGGGNLWDILRYI